MKALYRFLFVIGVILAGVFTLVYALFLPIVWILFGDGVWWRSVNYVWDYLDRLPQKF